jgi:hypothetical protein
MKSLLAIATIPRREKGDFPRAGETFWPTWRPDLLGPEFASVDRNNPPVCTRSDGYEPAASQRDQALAD